MPSIPTPRPCRQRRQLATAVACLLGVAWVLTGPALPAAAGTDPVGVWPLRPVPEVVAGFDPPADPWGSGHRGVDLAGRPGQPVHAALPGRITFAGPLAGRGVVVVSHGPTRTTYEPVSAGVAVGDTVAAGAVIGALQVPFSHCFPRACLHWGWLRGDTYLDPLRLVGLGPVRLWPLTGPVGGLAEPWSPVLDARLPGLPTTWGEVGRPGAVGCPQRKLRPSHRCCSGAGVGLLVGAAQPLRGDVGVALGGCQ